MAKAKWAVYVRCQLGLKHTVSVGWVVEVAAFSCGSSKRWWTSGMGMEAEVQISAKTASLSVPQFPFSIKNLYFKAFESCRSSF